MKRSLVRSLIQLAFALLLGSSAFAQSSDLLVTKSGPAQAAAGSNVSYDVTITNLGPDPSGSIKLDDLVPAGMTFVSANQNSGPTFTCDTTISCTLASMAMGQSADFTFVFSIPPATAPGTTFTNVATSTCPTDENPENDSAVVATTTPPPPQADMVVEKTGPAAAGPDTDVAFTITLTNAGPDAAQGVVLTDNLPAPMTFVSFVQDSGPPMTCGTTSCTTASFPAGTSATFTLTGHVPVGASGPITNTATVTTTTNDPNPESDSSTTTVTISSTDLAVVKSSSSPATVVAGDNITYTIVVTNAGPEPAVNASLSDPLPAGTTLVSFVQNNGPGASCSSPSPGQSGTISCNFATFGNGASAQFTLVIATGNTTLVSNTATVTSESFDTDNSDNSSTVNTNVDPRADLSIVKNGPTTVTPGSNVSYDVTVSNNGPSTAAAVSLTDTLPPNTTFVSTTQNSGPTFGCTNPASGAAGTITCTLASLAPGSSANFTFVFQVAPSVANSTTLTNTAAVSTSTVDPVSGNNSDDSPAATASTSADLTVTKTGPATVVAGSSITFTVTLTNNGPSDAQNVVLLDTQPNNTTSVSFSQTSGPAFTCVLLPPGPPVPGVSAIQCTRATLAAGATAAFDFTYDVPPTATGSVSNTASVTSDTSDPTPANGSSNDAAAIVPPDADMSITKTANGSQFPPGSNVTYTLVASNAGPMDAFNVVVTDNLPPGTTLVSSSSTQGSCAGTAPVTCTVGTLGPAASATITLVVTLPSTPGNYVNNATVTSTSDDNNAANNADSVTVSASFAIPALSPLAMLFLAMLLATAGLFVQRMR